MLSTAVKPLVLRCNVNGDFSEQGKFGSSSGDAEISLQSAMLVLGAKAFGALENQQRAVQWYVAALETDAHCYEAFKARLPSRPNVSKQFAFTQRREAYTGLPSFKQCQGFWDTSLLRGHHFNTSMLISQSLRVLPGLSSTDVRSVVPKG